MQDFQKTLELFLGYLKGAWVKKRYVIICSWLICPIGFVYVASMPSVYESQAKVYVDTNSVLQPLLRGLAIQTDPQQEIVMMVKTLLSRPNLEIIARESDLDIAVSTPEEYENLIDNLSKAITLNKLGRENLYTISYTTGSAEMARTVVQETLNLFVEGSKGSSRKGSDTANQFIDDQINEYEDRLTSAEQRKAGFTRKYSELLPNKGTFYANYANLEELLGDTRLTIKEIEQQILALAGQVDDKKTLVDDFSVRPSGVQSSLTTRFDVRITSLEENLDQLMLRYTELHPDVIEANNLLTSLKNSREKEIKDYLLADDGEQTDQIGSISSELKLEMSRLESQIASLKVREDDYSNKVEELKQKIYLVPQVEAERTALDRDYELIAEKHSELLSRKDSAELARRADVTSEDVQFKVIEPPLAPLNATGPNRLIFYTFVLVSGFGSGLALAFFISQLNPILIRSSQLTSMTSYPVLGIVGHLNRDRINKINRSRMLVFILFSSLIIGLYGMLVTAEILQLNVYGRIFS